MADTCRAHGRACGGDVQETVPINVLTQGRHVTWSLPVTRQLVYACPRAARKYAKGGDAEFSAAGWLGGTQRSQSRRHKIEHVAWIVAEAADLTQHIADSTRSGPSVGNPLPTCDACTRLHGKASRRVGLENDVVKETIVILFLKQHLGALCRRRRGRPRRRREEPRVRAVSVECLPCLAGMRRLDDVVAGLSNLS